MQLRSQPQKLEQLPYLHCFLQAIVTVRASLMPLDYLRASLLCQTDPLRVLFF